MGLLIIPATPDKSIPTFLLHPVDEGVVFIWVIWGEQAFNSGEKFLQFTLCGA